MSKENVLLLNKENGIATITLNRPDKLNAFNDELSFALQDALKDCEKDCSVKVLVITGAGRGFCSGQDLQARMESKESNDGKAPVSLGESLRRRYNPMILKIRT